MSTPAAPSSARAARVLLAKLVLGIGTLVALASSAPPTWRAEQVQELPVVFDERNERTLLASVDLAGKLYADLAAGTLDVSVTADRSASDLVLSLRRLPSGAGEPEPPPELQLGDSSDEPGLATARPDVRQPNRVWLSLPLACAEPEPAARAESCSEQFEIVLRRESERPLSVQLSVVAFLDGRRETQPAGAFQLVLEEPAP